MTKKRSIVAHFVKWGSDPIRLFALTVIGPSKYGPWPDRTEYSVEWSRQYGCYLYDQSGGGGRPVVDVMGAYHVSGDITVKERAATWVSASDRPPWHGKRTQKIRRRNKTRRLRQLPMSINQMRPGWDLLDWLQYNGIEAGAVYCSECDDCLPDTSDCPCDHVWWCHKTGSWSTPGERCECKDQQECGRGE